jgi:hypothetical protein
MKVIENGNETYYIGENAKDNHEMFDTMGTLEVEKRTNMTWFHLNDTSSAHVFVNLPKDRKLRKKVLKQAAYYVRYYSKDYGPVCYTSRSNLRKGGKPGEIIILDDDKLKVS